MSDNTHITPPPGYREDSQGRLVPEAQIPAHQLAADVLVRRLIDDVQFARDYLGALKHLLLQEVAAHIATVAAEYGVAIEGRSGGVSLQSYDGRLKIERASAERITVGPQIHAAEALVRAFLADQQVSPAVRTLVDRAFRRHPKTGQINVGRLLDMISVDIDDDRWREAQRAVRDALSRDQSITYFRAYRRERPDEPWQQISIDFSAIAPVDPDGDPEQETHP